MSGRQELRDDRTGFSLVELLMVAVVGSLIVIAGGQMFVSQSRLFIAQREILDSGESLRAATILLTGEIHEISAADGDLFSAQRDSLVLRSVQGAGVVCSHAWYGSARRLGIRQRPGRSVTVSWRSVHRATTGGYTRSPPPGAGQTAGTQHRREVHAGLLLG